MVETESRIRPFDMRAACGGALRMRLRVTRSRTADRIC